MINLIDSPRQTTSEKNQMNDLIAIRDMIKEKPWFKASDTDIQAKLMSLGEECSGFLEDLATRPDIIGNVRVLALVELLIPKRAPVYGIFPIFLVQRQENPSFVYTYQYFSWCQGPLAGAKGILLVEDSGGQITHFIVNRGQKFATGTKTYDGFGGFAEIGENSIDSMRDRFRTEIQEELGLEEIYLKEIVDLGRLYVDAGMTNNHPKIFAAIIDEEQAKKIESGTKKNDDPRELQMGTVIRPINELPQFALENDDSFFLSCVCRFAMKRGFIAIGWPALCPNEPSSPVGQGMH